MWTFRFESKMRRMLRLGRRRLSTRRWLICDMDNTLLDKKPGTYPRFRSSPCFEALLRWIDLGGKCLVVTSDDGKRPLEQFYEEIPSSRRRHVLISTAGGACLYRSVERSDLEYWNRHGGLPDPDLIQTIACNVARSYLLDSYVSKSLLDHLQASRREKIFSFLNQFSSLESLSEKLSCDKDFLSHGSLIPGLSFVWTNRCEYGISNMFILGMPLSISKSYVTQSIRTELNRLGSDCSLAPNSVCIKSSGVDKDTPLRWLHESNNENDIEFSMSNLSLAIGDNPNGNDRALTSLFDDHNLSFVNVGETPFRQSGCYEVGGFEHGTAFLIETLVDLWKRQGDLPVFDHAFLSSLTSDVRERRICR